MYVNGGFAPKAGCDIQRQQVYCRTGYGPDIALNAVRL
jgi:hypothetical protein